MVLTAKQTEELYVPTFLRVATRLRLSAMRSIRPNAFRTGLAGDHSMPGERMLVKLYVMGYILNAGHCTLRSARCTARVAASCMLLHASMLQAQGYRRLPAICRLLSDVPVVSDRSRLHAV